MSATFVNSTMNYSQKKEHVTDSYEHYNTESSFFIHITYTDIIF